MHLFVCVCVFSSIQFYHMLRFVWPLLTQNGFITRIPQAVFHGQSHLPCPLTPFFFFLILFIYFFIYGCVGSSFTVRGLSLVAASRGHSSSRCAGLSLSWPLLLRSTGSRRAGSVVVAHGPSCSVARGIFPDQGSNPCPLRWQADSQPLRHQGSPPYSFLTPGNH